MRMPANKWENSQYKKEISQSIEIDPEMTWIIRLIDKDIKRATRNMLHMFKKIGESVSMTRRNMEKIKKIEIKLKGMKNQCLRINTPDGISSRLSNRGEKISKFEGMAIEYIQNERQKEREIKRSKQSVSET